MKTLIEKHKKAIRLLEAIDYLNDCIISNGLNCSMFNVGESCLYSPTEFSKKRKMKKIMLLLMFISTISFSQARLGYKYQDILNEFSGYEELEVNIEPDLTEEAGISMHYKANGVVVIYYFVNKICNKTIIIPNSESVLQEFLDKYNKEYVVMGNNKWIYNTKTGPIYFYLKINPHNFTYFLVLQSEEK